MYVAGNEELRAVRQYIVDRATLIIDNNEPLYRRVRAAALDAVREDMGTGWSRDDFVMMLNGRGQTDRREVADVVGLAVCNVIEEWLAADGSLYTTMLADLLDLGDREQARMFGEHFMPEEEDWPADEEEEEEKEEKDA